MKYVRTKDGKIIDISNIDMSYKPKANNIEELKEQHLIGEYKGIEIVKFADTIEELCDDFVIVEKNSRAKPIIDKILTINNLKSNLELLEDKDIFGGVWTERGLTYIAKLNKEGDLELI